jgi:hypothetical protein
MAKMNVTRFIIKHDAEISYWSIKNGELTTLLDVINKWAAKRISDGRDGKISHVKKDCAPDSDQEERDVRKRIEAVIVGGEVPNPRDVVLISLASACQLLLTVFSDAELLKYSARVAEVSKMDLIGRAVSKSVAEVQEAVMRAVLYSV